MAKHRFPKGFWRFGGTRNPHRSRLHYRRARIELLEPRLTLSVQFGTLPDNLTVLAGAPLQFALNGVDAALLPTDPPPMYTFGVVGVSNVHLSNPGVSNPQLQADLLDPVANRSMKITVSDPQDNISGTMTLQLFEQLAPNTTARIINLANGVGTPEGPFYDNLTFHRVINNFMIQGGDPVGDGTGGSGVKFDDEINPQLQFTSAGILAMANSGPDTNDSQFFITAVPTRWLDFRYSIFGFLTKGYDVLQKIESVTTGANDKPVHNVVMNPVEVSVDGENRTLRLSVPAGTTGTVDLTVSLAGDPDPVTGNPPTPVTHTFHITIAADANNDPPFLNPTSTIRTTANTTINFPVPATDVEGDAITYQGSVSPANANLTFTVNQTTGQATLQAKNNWAGVAGLLVGATGTGAQSADAQMVPLYVSPAKPTVSLLASSDSGQSASDRITNPDLFTDATHGTLAFGITGLAAGANVIVSVDGVAVGQGTASSDTMVVRTPTTFTWTGGSHTVTAKQTLAGQTVSVGNLHTSVDLASDVSDPLGVTIDAAAPQIKTTAPLTAVRGVAYTYDVGTRVESQGQSNDEPGIQYQLTAAAPGMLINAQTGVITWTPGATQGATAAVTVRASDVAGNTADQSFTIQVQTQNLAPTASPQDVRAVAGSPKAVVLIGDDGNIDVVQALTYAVASQPAHGALSGFNAATGAVTYTPDAAYTGTDSFTFTVTDDDTAGPPGPLTSSPATVSINVVPVNHAPTANGQIATTDESTPVTITLSGDDGDPNLQQTLSYLIQTQPSHGTAEVLDASAGTVKYTPQAGYNGSDSFTFYTMDDNQGDPPFLTSGPATVSITINAVDQPPVARNGSVVILENASWTDGLPGDDGDPMPNEVQPIEFTMTAGPSHGQVTSLDSSTGAITYQPAQDYNGSDSITFTVKQLDTGVVSQPGTVTINVTPVNAPPVATTQQVTTAEDTTLAVGLGNDGDPAVTQVLTLNVVTAPSHGTLRGFNSTTGEVTYVPAPDFNGTDSFSFTLTDDAQAGLPNNLISNQATVTIQVAPVDDPPRFLPVQQPGQVLSGQVLQASVQTVDPDVPADPVRFSLDPGAPAGATIDPVSGKITFAVPANLPSGTVRLTVRATEVTPAALSATQTIDVPVVSLGAAVLATATAPQPQPIGPPTLPGLGLTSSLPAVSSSLPVPQSQFAFGRSDLLGSQGFFTYSFAPDRGGNSGFVPVETPETKPGQGPQGPAGAPRDDTGVSSPTSQQGSDGARTTDVKRDKSLGEGQTSNTSPALNDAALEEFTDGGDWFDVPDQLVQSEVLLASDD